MDEGIRIRIELIVPQFPLCLVDKVDVDLLRERRLLIEGLERLSDVLGAVHEVQHEGVRLVLTGTVEARKGLHALHAGELLVHYISQSPCLKQQVHKPELKLVQMSSVEPDKVEWLWNPYIPLGKAALTALCETTRQ